MVAKGVPSPSLAGVRSHGCGGIERACLSLGSPRLSPSRGEPQKTRGSSTMHNTPMDWSAVVTALAVLSIIIFLFLH